MSDDNQQIQQPEVAPASTQAEPKQETKPVEDSSALDALQAKIASLEAAILKRDTEFQAVLAKKDELLGEKKAEQEKARVALEDKLKNKGDADSFKQLLASAEEKLKEQQEMHDTYLTKVGQEKLYTAALKAASGISDGPNQEIMADIIVKRFKYVDGDIKVTDRSGELTVSTTSDLIKEFQGNDKYKSLLRGTKANGGGASGSGSSAAPMTEISIADFDKLSDEGKHKAMVIDKLKLID